MGLMLSSADVSRLEATLTTLLSPLASSSVDSWRIAANVQVRDLLGADKSVFVMPTAGGTPLISDDIEPVALDAYLRHFAGLDVGIQRQRQLGLEIWSVLELLNGAEHRRTEIWNEWKVPNALLGATGITVETDGEQAGMICYDRQEDPALEDRQVAILRLLNAAFRAGVRTTLRVHAHRTGLTQAIDSLADAIGLYDMGGRLLHANHALRHLLDHDPQRERLLQEIASMAVRLAGRVAPRTKSRAAGVPGAEVGEATVGGNYRLTGSYLGDDLIGPGPTVLVSIAMLHRPLPTEADLSARFGLTRREAGVALLLVQGISNRRIAELLSISAHTARHHTENVFLKLGVHSRAEAARRIGLG